MPENLHLVTELAIILIAAGVFTLISKALKQPLILGYIMAGFLVGPKLGLFPIFGAESIHEWSELGIIFLLFGLGLEFSFKKLLKIGSSALITAGVNCIGMFVTGIITAKIMGWGNMEGIFLGGMMSMSSTTIIIKAYDDLGLKNKPYSSLIFGTLVFEDLIAVLLMVLLSTLAVTGKFEGTQMLMGIMKLVFFLVLWFLVGIFVIPTILKKAKKHLTDEIMLLVSVGLCFLMVVLANLAGFSSALGAFVMGSILAETVEGQRIENLTSKIKDLFGAIFFVSVGMMVDPAVIAAHWVPILAITIITMLGILIYSSAGAIIAGQGLDTAVHAGFTLAQLGEFSFIIAGLGVSMGVLRDFIYPVIISVSVITTFTTPYMIKLGDPASRYLQKRLPQKYLDIIQSMQRGNERQSKAEVNVWKRLLKMYALRVGLYGVISIAIVIGFGAYVPTLITAIIPQLSDLWVRIISMCITLAALAPFLFGIAGTGKNAAICSETLLKKDERNKWPLLILIIIKALIATFFVTYVADQYMHLSWWTWSISVIGIFTVILLFRNFLHSYTNLETTFFSNYNAKEELQRRQAPVTTSMNAALSQYDVKIKPIEISADFEYIGKKLSEMPFRKETGINIIKITRGSRHILIPQSDEVIYPGDRVLAVGHPDQLEKFERFIAENTKVTSNEKEMEEFDVAAIPLTAGSPIIGRKLKESRMRATGCMLVGVLHDDKMITNPNADYIFTEGDTIWIAGEKSSIDWYKS